MIPEIRWKPMVDSWFLPCVDAAGPPITLGGTGVQGGGLTFTLAIQSDTFQPYLGLLWQEDARPSAGILRESLQKWGKEMVGYRGSH